MQSDRVVMYGNLLGQSDRVVINETKFFLKQFDRNVIKYKVRSIFLLDNIWFGTVQALIDERPPRAFWYMHPYRHTHTLTYPFH